MTKFSNLLIMDHKIKYKELLKFTKKILKKVNLDKFSSNAVATGLCETSLRGVESHGIRLLLHYVNSAISGRKNPKPKFKFYKKFLAVGILDADNAFGHSAGMKAIEHCIKISKKFGIGVVAVQNSSHPGAMASMALHGAKKGYLTFAFTHADSLLLSHNGIRPYFGTNPICLAAPRLEKEPYCLDMATSMISWNKLLNHKENKKFLDSELAADKRGNLTKNPKQAVSLIGAGSYKGFGLSSLVEILCGVFTGMNFGREIPAMYTSPMNKPRKLGQLYITLKAESVISKNFFLKRMQKLTNEVRKEPGKGKKKVLLPNDLEIRNMKYQLKNGIKIKIKIFRDLMQLSNKYKVKLNLLK